MRVQGLGGFRILGFGISVLRAKGSGSTQSSGFQACLGGKLVKVLVLREP